MWKTRSCSDFDLIRSRNALMTSTIPQDALDSQFMAEAISMAKEASGAGEIPIGAIIVHDGKIISRAHNRRELDQDPTAHAEVLAIRDAASVLGSWRLIDCTLYVTLEPCPMCAGALVLSRVERVVLGARDPKGGGVRTLFQIADDERLNHRLAVTEGVCQSACSSLLTDFFSEIRRRKQAGEQTKPVPEK